MKAKAFAMEEIHNSLVNGNRKQMVNQIDEYGLYDFWKDYTIFLNDWMNQTNATMDADQDIFNGDCYGWFSDAVISYHRIKNR